MQPIYGTSCLTARVSAPACFARQTARPVDARARRAKVGRVSIAVSVNREPPGEHLRLWLAAPCLPQPRTVAAAEKPLHDSSNLCLLLPDDRSPAGASATLALATRNQIETWEHRSGASDDVPR